MWFELTGHEHFCRRPSDNKHVSKESLQNVDLFFCLFCLLLIVAKTCVESPERNNLHNKHYSQLVMYPATISIKNGNIFGLFFRTVWQYLSHILYIGVQWVTY